MLSSSLVMVRKEFCLNKLLVLSSLSFLPASAVTPRDMVVITGEDGHVCGSLLFQYW